MQPHLYIENTEQRGTLQPNREYVASSGKDRCFHELLESQVKKTPNAIAIVFQEQQWTYQELNAKANQLANYLRKRGVAPEVPVGICAERSLDLIAGIFGIFKAGGAYVPLDPDYPKERLISILKETQVGLLLTQSHLLNALPLQENTQAICLDTDWEVIARESPENPRSEVKPNNLAYIMFTSGSTGKPKGVEITHLNILYYIQAIAPILQINADDVYLHAASFSFSSSVRQLLVPLYRGATVVIASRSETKNPLSLFELIQKQGVTVFDTVQSVWRYGLQELEDMDEAAREALLNSKLQRILFSGELLPRELLKKVRVAVKNQPRIFNVYGQTETIGVCVYAVPDDFKRERGSIPVGYAYAHNQVYLLDEHLQPVAAGEVGELHVAGAGVARGYFKNPELNAEKFIANPFPSPDAIASEPPFRLYKTGDLARYLPDGTLEIVGRIDFQVKLRGMRVELGEIESLLQQHPNVKQTVVTAIENVPGDKRLVAYIVPQIPSTEIRQNILSKELRDFLSKNLPDYMVPSAFVLLDKLPLTPNGKLDRRALPLPIWERSESSEGFASPRDVLERELAQMWEHILAVKPIGIRDNFFELGGHSLNAARLFSQIKEKYHQELPLAALLQAPTIEQLADILRQKEFTMPWRSLVLIQPGGNKKPLFCIHAIGGNVLSYRAVAFYLGKDRPVYGLQALGLDGKHAPHERIEDMAADYVKEIRTVQPHGPYLLAGHSLGGVVAFEMAQQLVKAGEKVALLACFDTFSPTFDRVVPPLTYQLYIHGFNLKRLPTQDKLNYVSERLQWKMESLFQRISRKLSMQAAQQEPYQLPASFQLVEETNRLASLKYVPEVYPGKLTLLRAIERPTKQYYEPYLGWEKLAAGGVEIHDIAGHHTTLILEPRVRVLAAKLKDCLERADAEESS